MLDRRAGLVALGACIVVPNATGGMPPSQEPSPRERVAKVACYEPAPRAFGIRKASRCARVVKIQRVSERVWFVQLRRPPVYCFKVHLDRPTGERQLDVPGVGRVDEVRCPASAYAGVRKPDLRVEIRGATPESRHRKHGFVSLTAVGPSRTRVVVEADGDVAGISAAYCGEPWTRLIELAEFYSFRSTTIVRLSLHSLITTPHAVYFDSGGAHGAEATGCADLRAG